MFHRNKHVGIVFLDSGLETWVSGNVWAGTRHLCDENNRVSSSLFQAAHRVPTLCSGCWGNTPVNKTAPLLSGVHAGQTGDSQGKRETHNTSGLANNVKNIEVRRDVGEGLSWLAPRVASDREQRLRKAGGVQAIQRPCGGAFQGLEPARAKALGSQCTRLFKSSKEASEPGVRAGQRPVPKPGSQTQERARDMPDLGFD